MYAIIETGSKQYKVQPNDILEVEDLAKKDGASVSLRNVLLIAEGEQVTVGQPHVKNASVQCEVLGTVRGDKVIAFKFRHRENYRRKKGHRQTITRLRVKEIVLKGE
ncbi:MAG: 50S ribosomal protein L21 [Omnitrophica bacterium GWA2_50_21]|nr:MAG: 50S ribosomal protein L21 [Omnitrophica bacterium GWA2_50_21]